MITVHWTDPSDYNKGTNHGFEKFETKSICPDEKELFLKWVNEMVKRKPAIKVEVFTSTRLPVVPVDVVKEFKFA